MSPVYRDSLRWVTSRNFEVVSLVDSFQILHALINCYFLYYSILIVYYLDESATGCS